MKIAKYQGECQFCGIIRTPEAQIESVENFIDVNYYYHHCMHLCDRCVDKLNSFRGGRHIDEYWLPNDARRCGYPPFPYNKLKDPRRAREREED